MIEITEGLAWFLTASVVVGVVVGTIWGLVLPKGH